MIIKATIDNGIDKTQVTIEIDGNYISIEFPGTDASANIFTESGKITAYLYSATTSDPEVITLLP